MSSVFLVIDDDLVSQFTARYAVEQCSTDTQIYVCESAIEALELLTKLKNEDKPIPDYILLDLVMPEMDGWEFIDQLQNYNANINKIKVFIMSAFTNPINGCIPAVPALQANSMSAAVKFGAAPIASATIVADGLTAYGCDSEPT